MNNARGGTCGHKEHINTQSSGVPNHTAILAQTSLLPSDIVHKHSSNIIMKAVVDYSSRHTLDITKLNPESYKVKKISHQETEMQELYYKLKELVPNCSTKNKMSKTELLQHVIDYIFDLQFTLELETVSDEEKTPLSESFQSNKMEYQVNIDLCMLAFCLSCKMVKMS